jgi:hypothetical protein
MLPNDNQSRPCRVGKAALSRAHAATQPMGEHQQKRLLQDAVIGCCLLRWYQFVVGTLRFAHPTLLTKNL